MDYELAKQLKDAGWPQEQGTLFEDPSDSCPFSKGQYPRAVPEGQNWMEKYKDHDNHWVRVPTLSELISACGPQFFQLFRWDHDKEPQGKWGAVGQVPYSEADDGEVFRFDEATPEEAVAKLYLALNPLTTSLFGRTEGSEDKNN